MSAALTSNATQGDRFLLMALLLISGGLPRISNNQEAFYMHGHVLRAKGESKSYARRLDLAKELIKEIGRHDWAIGSGMVKAEDYGESSASGSVVL